MGINIIDFDGTVTDAEKGHESFEAAFRNDMKEALGLTTTEFDRRWDYLKTEVHANPTQYGWINQGVITVPAYADILMETKAIGEMLFQQEEFSKEDIGAKMYSFYKGNYDEIKTHFKPGHKDFLARAEKSKNSFIVTNAYKKKVMKKMAQLERDYDIPIIGRASKHVIVYDWDVVPESVRLPGFDRDSYFRRAVYGGIVLGLLAGTNSQAEDSKGLGDILEMDLLTLQAMGMRTALMPKSITPQIEIDAAENVCESLEEAADFLFS